MTTLTWNTLQADVATALVQQTSPLPTDFTTLFPLATSYAEGRIYRDVVMLATREQDVTQSTVANTRTLSLSGMTNPVIVQEGFALEVSGVFYPFDETTLDVIDQIWPQPGLTLAPNLADWIGRYWAPLDDHTIVICPTPPAAYVAQITGLFQPAPISETNPTTYLSTQYGDALFALVMQWMSGGLLRNYGAQADESPQAMSWEKQYMVLLPSIKAEERRRRGLAPDITPTPAAKA